MDAPGAAVRFGVVLAMAAVATLVVLAVPRTGDGATPLPVVADGAPFTPGASAGVRNATWASVPVLVFLAEAGLMQAVEDARGEGEATSTIAGPNGLRLFAFSAVSTHSGCTVQFRPDLASSMDVPDYDGDGRPDGALFDPCHHGMWDPFYQGTVRHAGQPGDTRLAQLRIELRGNGLWGLGFDGPVGPPR